MSPLRSLNASRTYLFLLARRVVAHLLGVGMLLLSIRLPAAAAPAHQDSENPIPLLAYYYIWFDPGSWDRAKVDFPLLGRYSSDDAQVMRQHVAWAKQVGIDGFIVSWKGTDVLNRRLEQLMEIAAAEAFQLVIIYQGLDFERRPLPIERIASDLDTFLADYAGHEAFSLFAQPMIILSGSWAFSTDEIAQITESRRDRLLILASERNAQGYQRLMDFVDGNAYYWSSVNPATFQGYQEKLVEMAQVIHAEGGFWIAPAAPGFDARLVGGTSVVERNDGATLRQEFDTAMRSSPDALGLISWNEFSENTHVEPSVRYGARYLEILADIQGGSVPEIPDFDSSEPSGVQTPLSAARLGSIAAMVAVVLGSVFIILRRRPSDPSPIAGDE